MPELLALAELVVAVVLVPGMGVIIMSFPAELMRPATVVLGA